MTHDLLLRNVRPMGGEATDVLVRDGRVAGWGGGPDAPLEAPGVPVEDGAGALLVPGFVEAHTHLDKSLWGMGWRRHQAGPRLIDKIETERRLKKEWDIDPARQSARQVVQSLRMGTTHIRTHVDVDDAVGLAGMEGVLATRAAYAGVMEIETVAFPQSGLMVRPGVAALMEEAMRMGADVVGGLDPCAIDRDPKGQLDVVFGLAERFGRPVDIHLHEPGQLGAFSLELIIERTRALGMEGRVTVSHAFCLGDLDPALVNPLLERIAALDIAIATTAPASRPVPAAATLRGMGIRLCAGSDGIRDTWGPYGNADMLERAMLIGLRNNFRRDEEVEMALDICTRGGAEVMRLEGYGIEPGCRADLVLVDGESLAEAVAARPARRLVVKRGRVVARNGVSLVEAP
ncbi:N-isopropylammelide isopropyl amidohydrolase [Roseomonas mucosa]|uniref:amidohydrolase family protein n=1 Tax=Roseomonas mucosa TaxID=207340 RepID=UPI002203681E|nr:amidohydrolase family protein [Roseomonas mucosa]MDT8275327.1 amidohydrolase family protein [Roseomonas mucosa]QDJ07931.1 N-isopropylammelide isopropyl amidohydrolase [Roseomonas mucosa]